MVAEMRRCVRDASLVVKNLFSQYDHHARGCVSGEQFLRVVSSHKLLSADKVKSLKRVETRFAVMRNILRNSVRLHHAFINGRLLVCWCVLRISESTHLFQP